MKGIFGETDKYGHETSKAQRLGIRNVPSPAGTRKRGEACVSPKVGRPWKLESVVDWFETEGSVFTTLGRRGRPVRLRVVVASQGENQVIKSICDYLEAYGFHPCFRSTRYILKKGLIRTRTSECELLSNLEQECFLKQSLPLLRTEKRRREVLSALAFLRERRKLPRRRFKSFVCSELH